MSALAPSNTKFIFGPSVWLRSLIQPPAGHGLAYIDWKQPDPFDFHEHSSFEPQPQRKLQHLFPE